MQNLPAYPFSSDFSEVAPGTYQDVASFTHTYFLAFSYNAPEPQLPIHRQTPQTFLCFSIAALYALVQSIDSTLPSEYHITSILSVPCMPYTLLYVQVPSTQNLIHAMHTSPVQSIVNLLLTHSFHMSKPF